MAKKYSDYLEVDDPLDYFSPDLTMRENIKKHKKSAVFVYIQTFFVYLHNWHLLEYDKY
jgi:hypothetical protein